MCAGQHHAAHASESQDRSAGDEQAFDFVLHDTAEEGSPESGTLAQSDMDFFGILLADNQPYGSFPAVDEHAYDPPAALSDGSPSLVGFPDGRETVPQGDEQDAYDGNTTLVLENLDGETRDEVLSIIYRRKSRLVLRAE